MVIAIDPLKIVYCAVPKAACTSVKNVLAAQDPGFTDSESLRQNPDQVHRQYPSRRFRRKIAETYRKKGWFHFTVVRDPLARCFSAYADRVVKRGELRACRALLTGEVALPTDPDPNTFFRNFQTYLGLSSSLRHHFAPTAYFTGKDLGFFDRVCRIEDLPALGADLSDHLGTRINFPRTNRSAGHSRFSLADLQADAVENLSRLLRPDYHHLNQLYDAPF